MRGSERTSAGARGVLRAGAIMVAGVAVVVVLLLLFANGASDPAGDGAAPPGASLTCRVDAANRVLPAEVHETSGLARSLEHSDLFWTHNDSGGDPELFGVAADGTLAARVRVEGASAVDWEDIEAAPCRDARGGCLYIADTGDNDAERDRITIYELPEPDPGQATARATALHARYPDGARDAEGLFIADGRIHIVTKGREGPIRVYRFPAGASEDVTLEPLTDLAPRPGTTADYVTAATASPDGRWVAVRTYRMLFFFEAAPLLAGSPGAVHRFDLAPLGEAQGEAVTMDDQGGVWLTSEARGGAPASWSRLTCELPAEPGM